MKQEKTEQNKWFSLLFVPCGIAAIVAGGVLSAFMAHAPNQFAMWCSAYLVLVVGIAQVGFGMIGQRLSHRQSRLVSWLGFFLYNIGNLGVILGVALKNTMDAAVTFVDVGGILIVLAVLTLCYGVYGARRSWILAGFYAVAAVIVISAPIGLFLAH